MKKDLQIPAEGAVTRVRLKSERELFDILAGDQVIARLASNLRESHEEAANRRRLLASALRITESIIPSLMERIELVKRVLHLESDVETYIYNSPQHSASCMYFKNGSIYLLISSGLYSKLTERELLFLVGHEFGHVVFQHHMLPVRAILAQRGVCNAEQALSLMSWARRAEISADRVGLLCCQDLDVAAKALIKLSCGLSDELVEFDLQAYVSQMSDIEAISRTGNTVEDFYSTHPFNPIRVVALNQFWESATLSSLLLQRPSSQSDETVDARIEELLRFMDPDADTIQDHNVVECLVWGGFWVAASDGQIANAEVDALRKFGDSRLAREAALAIQRSTDPLNLIRNRFHRSADACRHLLPHQRHAMIQQLIAVAKAHFPVDAKEMETLRSICMALHVNPAFPEKILWQYEDFVFAQY